MKIVKNIQPKSVIFTDVKNRCMLHGRVFVMRAMPSSVHFSSQGMLRSGCGLL